ncbi:mannosyl-glycoprotein endo-beta-N-acetylglucosaminidase [Firmicutes bacterium CAG:582]|nr:mannosyl-glycoprotein endo-beta-N-acetylglucosaminidase [Firmicutes bacterium CAG:582]
MNKKRLFIFLLLWMTMPNMVFARTITGVVSGTGVYVRTGPGTNNDKIKMVSTGESFTMSTDELFKDESIGTNNCPNGWYKVNVNGQDGYICSNYLKVSVVDEPKVDDTEARTECEKEMKEKGFPSSYWNGLCSLKLAHPTWNFEAEVTDKNGNVIDFNASVNAFSSCGSSTIKSSSRSDYIDTTCTKKFDSGYSAASREAIKYYLDPRNFLNEKNIFMFENYKTNTGINAEDYKRAADKVFNNNFLVQNIPSLTEFIKNSSLNIGVSQMAISSRIKQELGSAKLTSGTYSGKLYSCVSGNYTTRYGYLYNGASLDNYYNFFNIAAYDGSNVTQKALIYAFNHGWGGTGNMDADRQTAMNGGTEFINKNYVNAGQDTAYYQKFNVFPEKIENRYLHPYMTNVEAPVGESTIMYNAYKAAGILESSFNFIIPVYANMDELVDPGDKPDEVGKVDASVAVISSGYRYEIGFISNIEVGTSVSDLKGNLESKGVSVVITDPSGNVVDDILKTGYKVTISGNTIETLEIVIYGDASGDGEINALDLLKVQKDILGTSKLSGAYKKAADASKDGAINALDLLKIQKNILGTAKLEQ